MSNRSQPPESLPQDSPSAAGLPVISVETLMGPHREVIIVNGVDRYRLRRTASGKLILTK